MNSGKFSFIIVTWNCAEYIESCLMSIFGLAYSNKEVIVVDNGSTDNTTDIVKSFKDVKFVSYNNPGFGYSCNRAVELSDGDYLFFLNPDTKIVGADLNRLNSFLNSKTDIAVVGSKLLWEDGRFQDSYKRFFSPFFSALELFEFHYYFPNNWLNKKVNYNFEIFNDIKEVDWVIGAGFVVKRDYFEKVGGFDENFFMYFEEIDLCRRIKMIGGKIYFYPFLEIIHYKGGSSQKTTVRRIEYYQSMWYYHKKYTGNLGGALIRFSIIFSSLLFLFVYLLKLPLKRKNTLKKLKLKLKLITWSLGV